MAAVTRWPRADRSEQREHRPVWSPDRSGREAPNRGERGRAGSAAPLVALARQSPRVAGAADDGGAGRRATRGVADDDLHPQVRAGAAAAVDAAPVVEGGSGHPVDRPPDLSPAGPPDITRYPLLPEVQWGPLMAGAAGRGRRRAQHGRGREPGGTPARARRFGFVCSHIPPTRVGSDEAHATR